MNPWYTWVFSGVGCTVIIVFVTFLSTKAHYFSGILFLERGEVDRKVGTLEERIRSAKDSLSISANDGKAVVESCSAFIDAALARGVRVRMLVVDSESQAPDMLAMIDPRFESSEDFKKSIAPVDLRFKGWKERYPTLFESRRLPILPALGFFIADPNAPKGVVKIEIYTAKPWRPFESRPHLILTRRSRWRAYFLAQFENYWNIAK